jgi:hypothetical protein
MVRYKLFAYARLLSFLQVMIQVFDTLILTQY